MKTVQELINEINNNREKTRQEGQTTYDTKSQRDELNIMRAMMNDTSYSVGVYDANGLIGQYCPALAFRKSLSNIISNSMDIPLQEAQHHINNYEFKYSDAMNMIWFSKEFINTYLKTGRKLPLGGRETSNVSLIQRHIPARTVLYPAKIAKNTVCESKEVHVEAYDTVRVYGSCPPWIDKKGDENG